VVDEADLRRLRRAATWSLTILHRFERRYAELTAAKRKNESGEGPSLEVVS